MNATVPRPETEQDFVVPGSDGRGFRHLLSRTRSYLIYYPLICAYTAVLGTASLLLSFVDEDGRLQHATARLWSRLILKTASCPLKVEGLENLQGHRSAVLAANHLSGLDIPVLYVGLPVSFRIVAKKELFRLPFLGWHLKRSGQIPVDDKNARASFRSLQVGVEALKHGHPVVIFPEGGRSRSGRLLPFMSGPFYMAVKAGVPIIPMAIIGTYETLPMNTYHLMPRLLRLVIGTPIPTEGCTARDMDELSAKAEAAIRQLLSEDSTQS